MKYYIAVKSAWIIKTHTNVYESQQYYTVTKKKSKSQKLNNLQKNERKRMTNRFGRDRAKLYIRRIS